MAEIERIANHLGDIGAICNDASFALMHAHTGALRELALRAADHAFGHRLMMDRIAPGGVDVDLDRDKRAALREMVATIRERFPRLVELYDNTARCRIAPSARDGSVSSSPALRLRRVCRPRLGPRLRRAPRLPYPPYDELRFETPVQREGDVNARVWLRVREVEQSLA